MSHFAVAVFSEDGGKTVEELLAPYHEFECTGDDNEFVQDIDITEEALNEYKNYTVTRYVNLDGVFIDPYADEFYREFTAEEQQEIHPTGSGCGHGISWRSKDWGDGKGYRAKVHYLPDGYKETELPATQVMSFSEFIEYYYGTPIASVSDELDLTEVHKYGYALIDREGNAVKLIKRTNPNKKWDYWRVGGRYRGLVKAESGDLGDKAWEVSERKDDAGYFDSARIKDINFSPDQTEYNRAIRFWEVVVEHNELKPDENIDNFWSFYEPEYYQQRYGSKETYAKCKSMFVTYAVVTPDGVWHEKGEMGWFGCGSETNDEALNWDLTFKQRFIDSANPNWVLTVVDCHI